MSVTQCWLHLLVPDTAMPTLRPLVDQAILQSPIEPEECRVFERWRGDPQWVLKEVEDREGESRDPIISFHTLFNLRGFAHLAAKVASGTLEPLVFDENLTATSVFTRNITPVSVLYFSLGPDLAGRLPGRLGNLLCSSDEVAATLTSVSKIIGGENRTTLIERGVEMYSQSGGYPCDDKVIEILDAWPTALSIALNRRSGLFSIGFSVP